MTYKGYTLIELLVVITIGIIVFSIGIAGYREFSRRQALTGVTKATISDLRLIQQQALTGQKPTGVVCTKLVGYIFTRTSSTNYRVYARCDNAGVLVNHQTKSVDLTGGTTFSAGTASILFKVLGQGTDLSGNNILTFTNTASGATSQIAIGTGGNIQQVESQSQPLPTQSPAPTTPPTPAPPGGGK
jgi:type II secretory pathway pseudopilin PulG